MGLVPDIGGAVGSNLSDSAEALRDPRRPAADASGGGDSEVHSEDLPHPAAKSMTR